jgi:hypothetical protein
VHAPTAPRQPDPRPAHSGFGIAAFVIALVVMLSAMVATPLGLVLQALSPRPLDPTTDAGKLIFGVITTLFACDLAAAGFAIAALRQQGRSRVFPMIALVIAGLTVVAIGVIVLLVALAY